MEAGIRISVYCLTFGSFRTGIGCMYGEKLEDHCRITVPYNALKYRGSGESTSEEIDNSNSLPVELRAWLPSEAAQKGIPAPRDSLYSIYMVERWDAVTLKRRSSALVRPLAVIIGRRYGGSAHPHTNFTPPTNFQAVAVYYFVHNDQTTSILPTVLYYCGTVALWHFGRI
jgi:hypothetical protein